MQRSAIVGSAEAFTTSLKGTFSSGEKEELLLLVERGLGICKIDLTDWWHVRKYSWRSTLGICEIDLRSSRLCKALSAKTTP